MISLQEGLKHIDAHDYRDGNGTFPIQFIKCNRSLGTGGEVITLEYACACGLSPKNKGHEMRGIKDMDTGKEYPVHNRLMFQIAGEEVFWV